MFSEESIIFYGILTFMIIEFVWEMYLSIRQHRVYAQTVRVPDELKDIYTYETFEKSRLYGLDNSTFSIFEAVFEFVLSMGMMYLNGLAYFWFLSERIITVFGFNSNNEIIHSLVFCFILDTLSTVIYLPLSIYDTFVLEEMHGFNKQTINFFLEDNLKAFAVEQIIVIPSTAAMIYIVKIGGRYFFLYLWMFFLLMTVILVMILPNLIAPLFDNYTPLPDGELKTKIEELAASVEFPLYELLVVEGSRRSAHSNAFLFGFFKSKRIVLFDTLLKDYTPENQGKGCDTDEVVAVLCHEFGHWKLNHVLKNFFLGQLNLCAMFLAIYLMFDYGPMYHAFGFNTERPVIIGLMIVTQYVFSPFDVLLEFLLTILSRKFELEADAFVKSLGKSKHLQSALIKLNQDNLSFPVYDWMYSMWNHSHPPLLERLKAIDKVD